MLNDQFVFAEFALDRSAPERFRYDRAAGSISCEIKGPGSDIFVTTLPSVVSPRDDGNQAELASCFDLSWLRSTRRPSTPSANGILRIADLFCGCGGLSLGAEDACRAVGPVPNPTIKTDSAGRLVVDLDADPRNANWLRIVRVHRLTGYQIPDWAALWLWWLAHRRGPTFWSQVARVAGNAGVEKVPLREKEQ